MFGSFGERLTALMRRQGKSDGWVARQLDCSRTTVVHWRFGRHAPTNPDIIAKLAKLLQSTPSWLIYGNQATGAAVPIAGTISSGGRLVLAQRSEVVEVPAGVTATVQAYVIDDTSNVPRYSPGDVIYVAGGPDGSDPHAYEGKDCLCDIGNAAPVLRLLMPGAEGRWILESYAGQAMQNVHVARVWPVVSVLRAP